MPLVVACPRERETGETPSTAEAPAKTEETKAEPGVPPLRPENATPTVATHMQDHFTQASAVRDAVIAGDLDQLRPSARWLAEHVVSDTLPETWTPHVAAMQQAASKAAAAETAGAAAASVGAMAQACGACHSSLGGPTFEGESPEAEESSVAADMQRHRWAADRMWEGLVGPSDTAWQAGVVALADARLTPEAMADDRTLPKEVFELAEQAHQVGAKGGGEKDPAKRAELYGRYLGTCAACHAEVGVKPPRTGNSSQPITRP
jgi:mono/diheme cytochrome c family protein